MMTGPVTPDAGVKLSVCQNYSRAFISHLMRNHDLTGMKLATIHNVFYLNKLAADMRKKIKNGEL